MLAEYGGELDWNHTLPAWELYSRNYAKLYPKITEANWSNPNAEIKILSALFGWIRHTDLIPNYLQMSNFVGIENIRLNRFWRELNVLGNLVNQHDIDLLSANYRKAFNKQGNPIALEPNVNWQRDRGSRKRIWLNSELNQL